MLLVLAVRERQVSLEQQVRAEQPDFKAQLVPKVPQVLACKVLLERKVQRVLANKDQQVHRAPLAQE